MIQCDLYIKQLCPYVKGKTKKIIDHRLNNINIIIKSMLSKPQVDDYLLVEISNQKYQFISAMKSSKQ